MGRLTGLTIQIGGDSTDLNKALKEPTKNANDLQSKLKEVDKALKLDPKNTELLAQKQTLLKEAVSGTNDKLKLLKQAQQEFKDSGGDLNSKAYIQLEADIVKTEAALKNLNDQQTHTHATLQSIGMSMSDFGSKVNEAGKKLLPLTAGLTAIGAAAMGAFSEVDNALDTIVKKTGATGEAMNEFEDVFNHVVQRIPADMVDIGAAIGEINTRLGFTGKELEDASVQFLKFAEINDTDVNSSVQLVSRAMGDAGMNASQYGEMLDMLTKAAQMSGISIDKLTENITKYGAPMRSLGFDTASSISIFAQWEKAGVNTEIAFSGMKKAISNFMKEGKDAKTEFGNLIAGIQNGSITAQEALNIFGTKAGPDLVDAIQQGRFAYDDFLLAIESSEGTVSNTFEEAQDGIDKMKIATNSAKIALSQIGEVIGNVLAPILQTVSEAFMTFAQWFDNLPGPIKEIIVIVGMLAAALGPILMFIGSIASGIGALMPLVSMIGGLFTQLGAVFSFLMGPIGLVVAAIAAVIAIGYVLYQNWEEISTFCSEIWNNICESVTSFCTQVGENIQKAWNDAKDYVLTALTNIKEYVVTKFNEVVAWLSSLPETLAQCGADMFNKMKDGVVSTISDVGTAIQTGIEEAITFITELPTKALTWGKDMINGFAQGIGEAIGSVADGIGSVVNTITSFLHFSRPDKGPLRYYEKWMPDFMGGLAKGIHDNLGMIKNASAKVSSTLAVETPQDMHIASATSSLTGSIGSLKEGVISALQGKSQSDNGTYVFPIYIGNKLADEFVLDAAMRQNVRSGGY